jgi:hypothetical protein
MRHSPSLAGRQKGSVALPETITLSSLTVLELLYTLSLASEEMYAPLIGEVH